VAEAMEASTPRERSVRSLGKTVTGSTPALRTTELLWPRRQHPMSYRGAERTTAGPPDEFRTSTGRRLTSARSDDMAEDRVHRNRSTLAAPQGTHSVIGPNSKCRTKARLS
jgi:hypothetical protein